jgi:hypothetical protein
MICFGVTNTIGSPISGILSKHVGRPFLFIFATGLNIGALVAMDFWHLARKQLIVFFVIPGVWGLADSIWQTQSAGNFSFVKCNSKFHLPSQVCKSIISFLEFIITVHSVTLPFNVAWKSNGMKTRWFGRCNRHITCKNKRGIGFLAALVGLAFSDKQEPAFSNLRMFQALGFTIGYLYSNHLCEYIKLYIAGGQLIFSMILVLIVEFRLKRNAPHNKNVVI